MKNLISLMLVAVLCTVSTYAQKADSSRYYFEKGNIEFDQRKFLLASQYFIKASEFDPGNVDAIAKCAEAYKEMRKLNLAVEQYEKLLSLQPSNAKAIEELTNLYFSFRQFDKAVQMANKCQSCTNREKIIGMSYYNREEYDMAEKNLLNYLQKYPKDAEANYYLGQTYFFMEMDKKALPFLESAVAYDDSKANWHYDLALVLYNSQQYDKSAKAYEKAIEKGMKTSLELMEQLGYSYLMAGNYDKGEEMIMKIFSRKPGSKDLLRDVSILLYKRQQFDRSLFYCQKLLESDQNDGKALYQAGLNFIKKGQKDRGESMCDKAISLDPSLAKLRKEVKMEF